VSLAITATLRTCAHRMGFGAILEIVFVASAFVITLAAHRNGMIHRPFLIGDFALVRGIDPAAILMGIGCAAVLLLSALLINENNRRRLPYHLAVLGLLCFSLLIYVRMFGLPTPQLTNDLGLTGQEQMGAGAQQDNPFRDSENDASDKEAPVAVVVFRDDYAPLNGSYYFRESAYSQFNGRMLDFTTRDDMDRDLIRGFANDRNEARLLPEANDQRVPVRTTIGMLVSHRNPFGLTSPIAYENTPNPNNLRFKRTYDAYSLAPEYDFDYLLGRQAGNPQWSDEVLEEYLRLPDDPRYLQLATELTRNLRPQYANDPFAKAWAIKSYLDENGIYSLKNEHAYEDDPAASFLFGDLTGYCMHFAFAATYMYRSIGIPARVGIGYSVPEANRAGGSALLVQAIHGHAWPEIYFEGVGWVIVDPAPQQTLVDMTTDPQDSLQQLLGDMLRNETSFNEFLDSQRESSIPWQALSRTIALLLLAAIISAYLIKLYRHWIPTRAAASEQYLCSYRAVLDHLAGLGIRRHYGESREEFANRVSSMTPTFTRLTQAHLQQALGHSHPKISSNLNWTDLRQSIYSEINSNVRGWQRVIAFLNPAPWLMSR